MQKNRRENKGKISRKLIIAAVVTTVAFAITSIAVFYTLFYRKIDAYEYTFPDFVGSYEADLPSSDFEIKKNYVPSDIYPEGVIISQSPDGLSAKKIKKGQSPVLTINISSGKESFVLPDLTGVSLREAETALRQLQAKVKVVRIYGDFDVERVSETKPQAEEIIHTGDTVILYVETPKRIDRVKLPSVIGLDVDEAARVLTEAGLEFEIEEGFDFDKNTGEVIFQSPVPNAYINKETKVTITVNTD